MMGTEAEPAWESTTNSYESDRVDRGSGGDIGLPDAGRRALVSLLTNRYIWRDRNRAAWDGLINFENDLRIRLADMFLDLHVDHEAGVAFKRQQSGDDVPKLLRRERALSRDASFVMLMLFREYAFADPTDGPVVVSREQISEFLRSYREEGDGNEAGFARRVDTAINMLVKPWQLLEPDPAVDYLFRVSAVIVPLLGVDEIARLEAAYRREAAPTHETDAESSAGTDLAVADGGAEQ